MASGTLPVIYIDTEGGMEIVDKVTPVPAEFYIDPTTSGQEAVGSAESPVELTIRGRGNYTWQQVKKPYKLKFDKKISLFGLPKSKHYALLASMGLHGSNRQKGLLYALLASAFRRSEMLLDSADDAFAGF